jgi:hypothetical protein
VKRVQEQRKNVADPPLIRERIKLLRDVLIAADFFLVNELQLTIPLSLSHRRATPRCLKVLEKAKEVLAATEFKRSARPVSVPLPRS